MNKWTPPFTLPIRRWLAVAACALIPAVSPAQVNINLGFSTPASNAAPGAIFSGPFNFSSASATIVATITSGVDIVPPGNVSLATPGTNGTIFLTPLPGKSGPVGVDLRAILGGQTDLVSFVAVFLPYPPTISTIANRTISEDSSTNVPFIVSDPDTPLGSLVLTASATRPALLDAGGITLGGSGSNRTVLLVPNANENGTSVVTVVVTDGLQTNSETFNLVVTPVADPSTITGLANRAFGDNAGLTNVFTGIGIDDVDHNRLLPEQLVATATLSTDQFATFANGLTTYGYTGLPAQVTAAMAGVAVLPLPYRSIPGTINNVGASVRARGVTDNITVTSTVSLAIEVINTPPTFNVILNPTSIVEGATAQPFFLSFIYDADIGDDTFTLALQLVNTNQAGLLTFNPPGALTDNAAGLQADIRNINVQATAGALTSATETVAIRFLLTDGYGGTSAITNILTLTQSQSPPQITGVPVQTINKTSTDAAFTTYPTVFVQDPNQGGLQPVRAVLSQSDPTLGTLSTTNIALMTPAQLSLALQAVTYTPTPGARPVGVIAESILTLRAIDVSGLAASNTSVKVRITSVNGAPQILNLPAPADQPVLVPPAAPVRPFAALGLSNDDTNAVVFTVALDNAAKGGLTNLGGFALTAPGTYQMTGSVATIVAALTNLAYVLNPAYTFPPDDPGGTTFTLIARDYALLASTRTLYIQIQSEPRNHLVVRTASDGLPGSFTYALAQAGNNDVITFALPAYPAVVRLPGAVPNTLIRNLTIKGPGANLLTISGDNNGDQTPDRQLFRIRSRITFEGVTLSHGVASFGGALQVESNGTLVLRRCAVVDSVAAQYGGAIDVDGGQLTLDSCFIARNRLSADTGLSGGGVSVYSDKELRIVNTTFADNEQPNPTGDGGGALVVQNRTPALPLDAYLTHCTFIENEDASDRASAALSVDFGTRIRPARTIFRDFSGRNIEAAGTGGWLSEGGNICDDSSRTLNLQQGQSSNVFLLDHVTDLTETDPLLAPLNLAGDPTPFAEPLAGSPAIGLGVGSLQGVDQRGVLRQGVPDAGAVEFNALGRLVINEIYFDSPAVDFIELLVRRDSTPVDLSPYALYVDGVKVHDFAAGQIIGTNALFAAGAPASPLVNPGFGYVIAFTNSPISVTSDSNPTPVARPSVTNAALNLPARGLITIGPGGASDPVAQQNYLGTYLDPASGTNLLNTAGNSIALAPQYRGFALVPHSLILPGPFEGVDMGRSLGANQYSIGADVLGTPFGQANAEPLAVPDIFTVGEDELTTLPVRANDFDGDGNDRLVVVDVSPTSAPDLGDVGVTNSQSGATVSIVPADLPLRGESITFDPRLAAAHQALPVGVEAIDTFYYEVIDVGAAAVEGYTDAGGGTTVVAATNHRLTNGALIVIAEAVPTNFNGAFAVTVVDENSFAIDLAYPGAPSAPGAWETVLPREPSSRSEASVSVRVVGANDPPAAALDVITNVTERSLVRLMVRPELAGTVLAFPGDPVPAPAMLTQDVLTNDDDVDNDDTWSDLRAVGVLGDVHPISAYTGAPGQQPVIVTAPAHGLASGQQVLIANYGGHPSYNGYHAITVLDANTFTLPVYFVDDATNRGVWVILDETNRYAAVTAVGAPVSLTLRASEQEDHFLYNASVSAFLQGLAVGEVHTDRFYYAVEDSHGALGIGAVDVRVTGVNNTPTPLADPDPLDQLAPLVGSNTLAQVLANGLDLLYTLPPSSGGTGLVNLQVRDLSGALPGTVVLADFFVTDEDTALPIAASALLANDSDVDRSDILQVISVEAFSQAGAAVSLGGSTVTYNPSASSNLQALAREELQVDTFRAVISDGQPDGVVTALVAVLVIGVNDTPTANPIFLTTHEDEVLVFDPRTNDVEIDRNQLEPDDRLRIVAVTNWPNPGQADVDMGPSNVTHDATVSALLNQLADWQSFTNVFTYTITDNSVLFAVDDEFHTPADTASLTLDVLANDRDYTDAAGVLAIVAAGPTLHGGLVTISTNGLSLTYAPPPGFVGDDYFRYTIRNGAGDIDHGRVLVRMVVPAVNGLLLAADDHFTVAAGETAILPVLANDQALPLTGAGLTITAILASSQPGQPVLTNNTLVYVATNGLAPLTFRYEVSGGGSATAQAAVTLGVVERRGTLPVRDDAFSVLPGSFDNELDVLANDALVTASTAALRVREILVGPAHGTLTTNAAGTRLLYTPDADFIGLEQVSYLATDQIGGTGTGLVTIAVGLPDVAADFFKIAASTNPVPVVLDVLGNDRMLPNPRGTRTLLSVSPDTATSNGLLQVSGLGTHLLFTPSNTLGQQVFEYVVKDGGTPVRIATSRVTIATVAAGIYANPDQFVVRGGGANYELNVLTNDLSYPNVNKTYTLVGLGAGPDAPDHGGTVSIVGDHLVYTPAAGFYGDESFTYTLSDSVATDVARVTVSVRRGDLLANTDAYTVYYQVPAGTNVATAFTLPVLLNDRILPPLDQVMTISALGVGPNAPDQGGTVTIALDGLSLLYRPGLATATSYLERFTYEISDGGDRRASGVVLVRVQNRASNLVAVTQSDSFAVARNSASNLLPVLANDFVQPGSAAGWSVTAVSPSLYGATLGITNAQVRYTPPAGFVGRDSFTYSVSDGLGGTGSATVQVQVGSLPTRPDLFTVLAGPEVHSFDVAANDPLTPDYVGEYALHSVFGASAGGSVSVGPLNTLLYTPAAVATGGYPYAETFLYRVVDDAGGLVTGQVRVLVYDLQDTRDTSTITLLVEGRNDAPVITNDAPFLQITDKESVKPFLQVLVTEVDEQLQEVLDVTVALGLPAQGWFRNHDGFVATVPGVYVLTNVTAAQATARIRDLIFEPTENRIPVPTNEVTHFTITVSDRKAPPVIDTNSYVIVTAVNDAPVILGTRAGQTVYQYVPIHLFSAVTITEVDNLTLQPLTVTLTMSPTNHGVLTNAGPFALVTGGVFRATNLTAAAATAQLRLMQFVPSLEAIPVSGARTTAFSIVVEDGFAPPVQDDVTTVIARPSYDGQVRPAAVNLRPSFGLTVDTLSDFAVVGAPSASGSAPTSGVAFVYQRQPVGTNNWAEWRQLQPATLQTNDRFGRSVAISEDLIAVGAINNGTGTVRTGAVYLFGRHEGGSNNWGEVARIAPTGITSAIQFGFAVDLDGDLLAVGAPLASLSGAPQAQGAVFLFGRNEGGSNNWGEVARRVPSDAGITNSDFGWSVALSGDRLVVGAPRLNVSLADTNREGGAFSLLRDEGGSNQWGVAQRLVPGVNAQTLEFGWSASMQSNLLAVGSPAMGVGTATLAGVTFVYETAGGTNGWAEISRIHRSTDNERRFGYAVAVRSGRLFVGAPHNSGPQNIGAAYLFRRNPLITTNWILVERLTRPLGSAAGLYGSAVSLHEEAGLVGAPSDLVEFSNRGYAFFYRFKQNNPPVLATPILDPLADLGLPFSFALPGGTFTDPDLGDLLSLTGWFPAGSNGLEFVSGSVTGTPETAGLTPVSVQATDLSGASTGQTFQVIVLDGAAFADTPRGRWNLAHFGNDLTNAALTGALWGGAANPDGDGLDNDQEFAFGGDPQSGDSRDITLTRAPDGNLLITYYRRTDDPSLHYSLQGSANMLLWTDLTWTVLSETTAPVMDDLEFVTLKIAPVTSTVVQHYRILVLP